VQTPTSVGAPFWATSISVAICGATPVVREWTESVIHLADCETIPGVAYTVFTNVDTDPGAPVVLAEVPIGLAVQTVTTPTKNGKAWGDIAGAFTTIPVGHWPCPDGFTNINDLTAILRYTDGPTNLTRPHGVRANIAGANVAVSIVDPVVNVGDVSAMVRAVASDYYGPPTTPRIVNPSLCP